MQVDEALVRRIARLARIKVTDEEAKGLPKELSQILDWVKQLDEVDTKNCRADDPRRRPGHEEAQRTRSPTARSPPTSSRTRR